MNGMLAAPATPGGGVGDFNRATRPSFVNIGSMTFTVDGSDQLQLPQVGFLSELLINVTVNMTTNAFTGTVTNGTASKISPYSLIKQIVVRDNSGSELYRTSGSENYLIQRTQKVQFDPLNLPAGLGITGANAIVTNLPGSYATSTAYTIRFTLRIPIALDRSLQAGLILLQNPTTRLTLELQFGNSRDMVVSSDGTLAPSVFTAAINVSALTYQVPSREADFPSTSLANRWISERVAWSTARHEYKPPLGDIYLGILAQFFNGSTPARPTPASDLSQLLLRYAQTQVPISVPPGAFLANQQQFFGGLNLPDGVFWWNFADQFGFPELSGFRDVIDTDRITDMAITHDWGSLALTSAYADMCRHVLTRIVG